MRLFTFGCSFTKYQWPTWADILGRDYKEYYNYGMSGGGNLFIFDSLVEAIATHNINKDDIVTIMWTNVTRDDRYSENHNGWLKYGNIYTSEGYLTEEFIEKFITVRGCYVRDMPLIFAAYKLLSNLGCKFYFTSMVDIDSPNQYMYNKAGNIKDVLSVYNEALKIIRPSIFKTIFGYRWNSRFKKQDPHPHPIDYLDYIERVLPEFKVTDDTKLWVKEIDTKLKNDINVDWEYRDIKRL